MYIMIKINQVTGDVVGEIIVENDMHKRKV